MLSNLSEQIRECYRHAEDCARQAAAQTCSKLKEEFLDMERRWLFLARSYEFSERVTDFSAETKRQAKRPCSTVLVTPFLRGQAFEPELVEAMGAAFVSTCAALGLTGRPDAITELVAEKIVELAQRGLRDPTAIHTFAMRELKSNPNSEPTTE
jgi:hypothetical protein